ncbi:glycosyltransferase [Virgisporangium ochraceum]|uniref:Glycosyl transferase n=1 Tax=Virgisporangium ochraceum TaxID=65505 RepID=A0A8J4EDP2_9ACTN|nr:glycosyltransferase [Virgisporangium ochraceum]GIJ71770.1 glycosyl transferase [Virgisporangium ochraceum]
MNILVWHVHGSWMTAFIHGRHRYLVPVDDERGPYGLGRARTYRWPYSAVEVTPDELASTDIDVVVLQRPEELPLARAWLGDRNVPTVYVEHNTPKGDVPSTRHPMADRDDVRLVHVTHFNELFWDNGATRTAVIEHGIVPPVAEYSGDLERIAIVTNEPVRRGRVTGTDLMGRFGPVAPLDVFGMGTDGLPDALGLSPDTIATYNASQDEMHTEIARRRLYLHLTRWTSLGLSLIEAMAIGLPVVALATTEVVRAVPEGAGIVSTKVDDLVDAARWLIEDPDAAQRLGQAGSAAAKERYDLDRFLFDWDRLLEETCTSR